jgi:aminoglycoside phosphotransferase (APT) family kinase protein
MITKPSLSDLLEGVSKTAEEVLRPAMGDSPVADVITGILVVLDRVEAEWPSTTRHLADDNLDIEHTLRRIARTAPSAGLAGGGMSAALTSDVHGDVANGREHQLSAHELAEHNRRLKDALVWAMGALDLPARADDPPAVRHADLEVRQLLLRMLHREGAAHRTTPPRLNPLSRGTASLSSADLERMTSALHEFIGGEMPDARDIEIANFRSLAGGASREAFVFDVSWTTAGGTTTEKCVMLRQPVSSVLESDESETRMTGSRRLSQIEFKMIRLMEAQGIPVPHMLWVEPTGKWLERPFSVARWIEGEADLTKLAEAANLERILEQYIEILARIHNLDLHSAGVDFLGTPTAETAALEQVELFEHGFNRQRLEGFPAITYMVRWLKKHQPVASRVSVIHGDFRLGNFMWDDNGIVAMLDWEQCHVGDPLEEIAFMYWPLWTLEPLIPLTEFIRRYEEMSGITVDRDALAYYRVFIELKMAVVIMTGIKSFFATPERQLMYGAVTSFGLLRDTQLRVIEELLNDGPTFEFRGAAVGDG